MGEFYFGGLTVEIDGVDRDDLPPAFDFGKMKKQAEEGKSVEEMKQHVHGQSWVDSERERRFWDVYTGETIA